MGRPEAKFKKAIRRYLADGRRWYDQFCDWGVEVTFNMSRRLRFACIIAVTALMTEGCGVGTIQQTPQGQISSPPTTSWLQDLTPSTTPTTTPTTVSTTSVTGSWVDATANLTGLPSECGNLSLVSARPDKDVVIAGVAGQGLWASGNGSPTWTSLGRGAGSVSITNTPSAIVYDPSNPSSFWESGIYGGGLYQTVDGGITFKQLGDLTDSDFVSVDLSDPARRTLLSGMHERSNLFRSTDGGATWADLTSHLPTGIGYTAWPLVISQQLHLLGTTGTAASGVFRTTDGGSTWSRVYEGAVSGPALVAKSDGAIYWLLDQGNGIIRSTDKGLSWQTVIGPGQIAPGATSLLELPDGRLATFGTSVIVSANHGRTWQPVGPPLPYLPRGLVYAPFRGAFYIWHFDCNAGENPVRSDAIMRLSYNYKEG